MSQASVTQIAQAIIDLSKASSNQVLAEQVAAYVVAERRSAELDAIMREVIRLRSLAGINEATITTADQASEPVKELVKQMLGSDNLILNEVIDKKVIGGVRVESNDFYLDLTVRNRLNKLRIGA